LHHGRAGAPRTCAIRVSVDTRQLRPAGLLGQHGHARRFHHALHAQGIRDLPGVCACMCVCIFTHARARAHTHTHTHSLSLSRYNIPNYCLFHNVLAARVQLYSGGDGQKNQMLKSTMHYLKSLQDDALNFGLPLLFVGLFVGTNSQTYCMY
jgi:hypothetical protein